jgi:hypothetical protein
MEETTLEPGTGTGVITEEDTRTDYRIDEGDHDRFAHYVDKSKPLSAEVVAEDEGATGRGFFGWREMSPPR